MELRTEDAEAFAKQPGARGEVAVLCLLAVLSGRVREPPASRQRGFWNRPRESLPPRVRRKRNVDNMEVATNGNTIQVRLQLPCEQFECTSSRFARYDLNQIHRSDFAALVTPSLTPCYAGHAIPHELDVGETFDRDKGKATNRRARVLLKSCPVPVKRRGFACCVSSRFSREPASLPKDALLAQHKLASVTKQQLHR